MLSGIKNFVITFCISAIIFGLIAYYVVNFATDSMGFTGNDPTQSGDESAESSSSDSSSKETETPATDENGNEIVEPSKLEGSSFSVVFIGTDYQPEIFDDYGIDFENKPDETRANEAEATETDIGFPKPPREIFSDSITLINVSKETSQITFLPLQSDTKVSVDGVYMKLGSVYSKFGGAVIAEKVSAITGFPVKYFAAVTIEDLEALIDYIGGVEYNVPIDMFYDDEILDLHINIKKGLQTLDGKTAVEMLRYKESGLTLRRSLSSGFLRAIIQKLFPTTNANTLDAMYQNFLKNIDTNYSEADVLANLDLILAYDRFSVVDLTYPGTIKTENSVDYFIPDTVTAIKNFKKYRTAD